jgi:flavin-dependent dehydrogenase
VAGLGLKKLGYSVTVLGLVRRYPVTEGISERVCQALASSGLRRALQTVSAPVSRLAIWNGASRSANTERLVFRPDFDTALLDDLRDQGVRVELLRVHKLDISKGARVTTLADGVTREWQADFVVDARGRSANAGRNERVRGPETVSLACSWESEPGAAFAAAASVGDGWLWLARHTSGKLFSQFTTRASELELADKSAIPDFIASRLQRVDESELPALNLADPDAALARSSTAILVDRPIQNCYMRVGDAAMAVDPLSGNGIFQSLSSALVAPAVINTRLNRPADAELAAQFYRDRLHHLFYRFARIGRDFYRSETRWEKNDFWRARRDWPDLLPAHPEQDAVLGTAERPVVNEGFIERRQVLVTADQPLGIWRVDGREVLESKK